jgi:NitT/TauT family transport system ATP-binding protein
LLFLLAGLQEPSAGQILIANEEQKGPRPQTGLILQDYGLLPWATARNNIQLGFDIRRFYGPDGKHAPQDFDVDLKHERVDFWIERLGLTAHSNKYPAQLSGGQRQRVAIARTLALQPDLLLMDEPFSSLDAPSRANLQDTTIELSQEQALTLVIVTHSIEEAAIMGEKILLLSHPPNRQTIVFPNPRSGQQGFRETTIYFELCRQLRQVMEPSS